MFKWTCLAAALIVNGVMLWMLNDVRVHIRKSVDTVNRDLPMILDKTRDSAETMSELSEDIKQLRELVVGDQTSRDENIVAYETEILKLIENSSGKIGTKKLIGTGLSDPVPAREWVARERKLALWDQARSSSKADLLNRIGRSTVMNRTWYIDTGEKSPKSLIDWVKANHAPSREFENAEETK
ncbi:MAG: hypothetical protein WCH39_24175 [Schlesneria sp.]